MQDVGNSETDANSASKTRFWEEYLRINRLLQLGIELTRSGPGDLFQV